MTPEFDTILPLAVNIDVHIYTSENGVIYYLIVLL